MKRPAQAAGAQAAEKRRRKGERRSEAGDGVKAVLATGIPGCGKTTLVRGVAEELLSGGEVKVKGFYTAEVLKAGRRVGFDIVTLPEGRRGVLSRKNGPPGWPKTGAYSVDVAALERLAVPTLTPQKGAVVVVDEIGRMELHSPRFQAAVEKLLASRHCALLGAITAPLYGHRVPFCDWVSGQAGVKVLHLKKSTREATTASFRAAVREHLGA